MNRMQRPPFLRTPLRLVPPVPVPVPMPMPPSVSVSVPPATPGAAAAAAAPATATAAALRTNDSIVIHWRKDQRAVVQLYLIRGALP